MSEVTATAIVALAALLGGLLMTRVKQPAVVGYIFAGLLLGPAGLGLVADGKAIHVLAEFGVLLLLFLVGMELNLRRFVSVWKVSLATTLIQIAGSVGLALLLRYSLGWSLGLAVVIGFVVSISSTAVVIKLLESADELSTATGRLTVGILVAQDMAVVPMMLVLGALAEKGMVYADIGKVAFSLVFLVILLWFLVRRTVDLPFGRIVAGHADLSPVSGLAFCFGAAALSGLLDLSPAYGAFLAGVIIGNSAQRAKMIAVVQPIQSVLMMVFFVSIGLLLDLGFIWDNLGTVLLLLFLVTIFKTALNVGALKLLGETWPHAVLVGVSLAQIGEFSFLLAEAGRAQKLITSYESRLIVSVTVLSLILSPFWLLAVRRMHRLAEEGRSGPGELWDAVVGRELGWLSRQGRALAARLPLRKRSPDA